jgi:cobalt-precorrin 5A hydrolase
VTAQGDGGLDTRPSSTGVAVFALTEGGARMAACAAAILEGELWLPESLESTEELGFPEGTICGHLMDPQGWPVRAGVFASRPRPPVRRFPAVGAALREVFASGRALVCVMATGVVVRTLAPALADKTTDPAVVVMDEAGRFVIPLLGGHLAGANALAGHLARSLGAQAVLTTSSDVQGLLGPDMLAAAFEGQVLRPGALLPVASALANGREVPLRYSPEDLGTAAAFLESLSGYIPNGPSGEGQDEPPDVIVTVRRDDLRPWSLNIVPRLVVAGVGCTRGTSGERIVSAVREAFERAGLHPAALRSISSIRAKADERGILDAAEGLDVPALFASTQAIQDEIDRNGLAESAFVRQAVGAGSVSEPASLWAAGDGSRLLLGKWASRGVTVALALTDAGTVVEKARARWSL